MARSRPLLTEAQWQKIAPLLPKPPQHREAAGTFGARPSLLDFGKGDGLSFHGKQASHGTVQDLVHGGRERIMRGNASSAADGEGAAAEDGGGKGDHRSGVFADLD